MMKCDPRAFARCPYRKGCSDSPEHTSFYEGTECDYFNQQVIHAPPTNADRIRAMSDEELAAYLAEISGGTILKTYKQLGLSLSDEKSKKYLNELTAEYLKRLQQPAEED